MALYEPGLGYYMSDRVVLGREGDYLTSPEVSPVFGAMLGRQFHEIWQVAGSPSSFDLVEAGAGSGALARDILTWCRRTHPELFESIRYSIVEISPSLAERQKRRLRAEALDDRVDWLEEMPPDVSGVIFSNELLDAMPVHRIAVQGNALHEVYVTWDGSNFAEELRDALPAVCEYFEQSRVRPGEGCWAEVNLAAPAWTQEAAACLRQGVLLTMDYGYEAGELYAPWRSEGTLLCFRRHNPSTNPYTRIGRQDMTSHIDLTTVRKAGEEGGLATIGLVSQFQFLTNLGITEAIAAPEGGQLEEYFARRRAVTELLDPGGLGRISVLVQAKDISAQLTGLRAD
jgi:SAM-dependent MidA family methyltransferase